MMKTDPEDDLEQASIDRLTSYTEDRPLLFGMVMSLFMLFEPQKGEEKAFKKMKKKFIKNVDERVKHNKKVLKKGEQAREDNTGMPGAAK